MCGRCMELSRSEGPALVVPATTPSYAGSSRAGGTIDQFEADAVRLPARGVTA